MSPGAKHVLDWSMDSLTSRVLAIGGGLLSYFKAVPWPDVAGFLSCVWLLVQLGHWIYKRTKR